MLVMVATTSDVGKWGSLVGALYREDVRRRSMAGGQIKPGEHTPIWVGELDVANPPARLVDTGYTPAGSAYTKARVLVRFQGEPLGVLPVALTDGEVDVQGLRVEAEHRFGPQIEAIVGPGWTASSDALPAISAELAELALRDLPAVSVVIGTRNRPDHVVQCVERVLKQDYPSPVEVIVVDNGASDSATADAIQDAFGRDERVKYMHESRPGLSRARNIGLSAARYSIVAFLSDDIQVDSLWLLAIARGFERDETVRCVTAYCPPLYLDTTEQLLFESSMAWGTRQGFEPVLYAFESSDDPVHPYRPGSYVNGSNMAYATEVFRRIGGFDESLGPGTRARGGEDLDAPIRLLAEGWLVALEPSAIGWHADRYDDRSFSQHMFTYGLGLTAFLAKHLTKRQFRSSLVRRIPSGLTLLLKPFDEPDEALNGDVSVPARYHLWHLAGRVAGPFAYLASRRSKRQ